MKSTEAILASRMLLNSQKKIGAKSEQTCVRTYSVVRHRMKKKNTNGIINGIIRKRFATGMHKQKLFLISVIAKPFARIQFKFYCLHNSMFSKMKRREINKLSNSLATLYLMKLRINDELLVKVV